MKQIAQLVSALALAATIAPPLLFFSGRLELGQVQYWMLVATVAWFGSAPLWMDRDR